MPAENYLESASVEWIFPKGREKRWASIFDIQILAEILIEKKNRFIKFVWKNTGCL